MDLHEVDRRNFRAVSIAIGVNVALVIIKTGAGFLGHSYALIADGAESMTDVGTSVVAFGALRLSRRPPDASHPYGHGKAEPLLAIGLVVVLIIAAIGIGVGSVHEIAVPHQMPHRFTLVVLALVVLIKAALSAFTTRVARVTGSTAVHSDAAHHLSDAVTSGLAFVGISIGLITGYAAADDWAALCAVPIVVVAALRQLPDPVGELLDGAQPEMEAHVRDVASTVAGVEALDKCLVRKAGRAFYVDLHVEVDPQLPVRDGHEIAHRVQAAIRASDPRIVDVLVHVEPHESGA
ncbi:MAG: cation diffusion facilitator family transporter [Acidobacteriota bacterium]